MNITSLDGRTRGCWDITTTDQDVFVLDLDEHTVSHETALDNLPRHLLRARGLTVGRPGVLAVAPREPGIAFRLIPVGTVASIARSQQIA